MASTTLYVELEATKSIYADFVNGVNVKRIRRKAPKEASEHTRWILVRIEIEDPDTLFKEEQKVGSFGLVPPIVEAVLEEQE